MGPNSSPRGHARGRFNRCCFPGPKREQSYNDDGSIPLYLARNRAYAGAKRKGIRGDRTDADSIGAHVRAPIEAPFFLSQEIELPPALIEAAGLASPPHPTPTQRE